MQCAKEKAEVEARAGTARPTRRRREGSRQGAAARAPETGRSTAPLARPFKYAENVQVIILRTASQMKEAVFEAPNSKHSMAPAQPLPQKPDAQTCREVEGLFLFAYSPRAKPCSAAPRGSRLCACRASEPEKGAPEHPTALRVPINIHKISHSNIRQAALRVLGPRRLSSGNVRLSLCV